MTTEETLEKITAGRRSAKSLGAYRRCSDCGERHFVVAAYPQPCCDECLAKDQADQADYVAQIARRD